MTVRVAILISGGGSNMLRLVESMSGAHPARPVVVLSDRPDAGGLEKARALGINAAAIDRKAYDDRRAFEAALLETLAEYRPDLICLAGFMRVLSAEFVTHYENRIINIHPSLLPKYKGLDTHQRALDNGDTEAGCTVHVVTAALDDGPLLGQAKAPVMRDDTATTLAARVLEQEHRLYPMVLRHVSDALTASGTMTPLALNPIQL